MKVSVALCSYNGLSFLAEQLESILHQSRKVDEIICCDDGSDDGTWEILGNYAAEYPGIFLIYKNEQNLGPRKNFEQAIGKCTGDIIFLCDQDDRWVENKVERILLGFENDPACWGLFSNGWLMDQSGEPLDETMWDALYFESSIREHVRDADLFRYILLNGNIATGTAMAFRREVLPFLVPFFTGFNSWHDHWMALVLSAMNKLGCMDEPLLHYRVHAHQQVGFPGRMKSDLNFRNAVHVTWLKNADLSTLPSQAAHLAFGLQTFEKYLPSIKSRIGEHEHLQITGQQIKRQLTEVKTAWMHSIPYFKRKLRLLKHWLKGGEYLRISFSDLIRI